MTGTLHRRDVDGPPKRRSRLAPLIAGLLLAALAFTVSGVFPFRQLIQQRQQVDAASQQLDTLRAENDRLAEELDALHTDDEIERIAREQYGLVRPGEEAFVVIVPDAVPVAPAAPVAGDPAPSWWQRMWLFVTGGDVGDG